MTAIVTNNKYISSAHGSIKFTTGVSKIKSRVSSEVLETINKTSTASRKYDISVNKDVPFTLIITSIHFTRISTVNVSLNSFENYPSSSTASTTITFKENLRISCSTMVNPSREIYTIAGIITIWP